MTVGSLFSGIAGFELGLIWAGLTTIDEIKWQVEIDSYCNKVLEKHFPNTQRFKDIKDVGILDSVDLICGGDPCPIRSKARGNRPTKHPDLSGYFLAVVGRGRPRWVLRENVPASDDIEFKAALEFLGYETIIIRSNSAIYTGQNRRRDLIIGNIEKAWSRRFIKLYNRASNKRAATSRQDKKEGYPCLTTHGYRYDARDGYIWDGRNALRVADIAERTKLAGFPDGWLDGLSKTRVAKMTGNAVVPQVVQAIGEIIMEWENEQST